MYWSQVSASSIYSARYPAQALQKKPSTWSRATPYLDLCTGHAHRCTFQISASKKGLHSEHSRFQEMLSSAWFESTSFRPAPVRAQQLWIWQLAEEYDMTTWYNKTKCSSKFTCHAAWEKIGFVISFDLTMLQYNPAWTCLPLVGEDLVQRQVLCDLVKAKHSRELTLTWPCSPNQSHVPLHCV